MNKKKKKKSGYTLSSGSSIGATTYMEAPDASADYVIVE